MITSFGKLIESRNLKDKGLDLTDILRLGLNFMLERLAKIVKLKRNQSYHFRGQHFIQIKNQIILIYRVRFVKKPHFSDKCPRVTDIATRRKYLRNSWRFFMCFRSGYKISDCTSTKTCFYYKERSNSALCVKKFIS